MRTLYADFAIFGLYSRVRLHCPERITVHGQIGTVVGFWHQETFPTRQYIIALDDAHLLPSSILRSGYETMVLGIQLRHYNGAPCQGVRLPYYWEPQLGEMPQ